MHQNLYFGSVLESDLSRYLSTHSSSQKVVIVDKNTHEYCLEYLLTSFDELKEAEVIMLPAGEQNKVLEVCFQVWQALSEYGIQRNDLIINLGGGVVTDMGGFIASVYKRGIKFINIPTSLLGMVDASVGGKTGIDLGSFKNQLGTFSFPEMVICDTGFLHTLPDIEFTSGKAEMLKHGLIGNADHWKNIVAIDKNTIRTKDIQESVLIKKKIVEQDPFEQNERKKLNFGHTVGHALEGFLLQENPHTHGSCVAWGMLVESFLSFDNGHLSKLDFEEINHTIRKLYPALPIKQEDLASIIQLMKNDKKNEGKNINFNLIKAIGEIEVDCSFSTQQIEHGLQTVLIGSD
jgi:3-dehydroquinate synthase